MKLLASIKAFFALLFEAAAEVNEGSAEREQASEDEFVQELYDKTVERGEKPF